MSCAAVNCSNSHKKGFRLFRFPRDKIRRKQWLNNCRRKNWEPADHSQLCEIHFGESQFEANRIDKWKKLKPNAILTLFNVPNPPPTFAVVQRASKYKIREETILNESNDSTIVNDANNDATMLEDNEKDERCIKLMKENEELKLALKRVTTSLKEDLQKTEEKYAILELEVKRKSDELKSFLNIDQINALGHIKMKQWSPETVVKALKFRFMLGVHGYQYLQRSGYPIPSYNTLCRRIQNYKISPGIFTDMVQPLRIKTSSMEPLDRICVIGFDEIQINSSIDYDKHINGFSGYITLGNTTETGTHLLAVVIRGLKTKWKQTIACEVTSSKTTAAEIIGMLQKCICYVEKCGLYVLAVSSDMASKNTNVWKQVNVFASKDGKTSNSLEYNGHQIFVIPDVCHLIKNLKNALLNHKLHLPDEVKEAETLPTNIIWGGYVTALWEAKIKGNSFTNFTSSEQ